MKPRLQGLYGITDATLMPDTEALLNQVELSLQGGTRVIQYRDKSTDKQKRLQQAQALQQLCQKYQTPLLINDDVELAAAVNAAGVHLGQSDGEAQAARKTLGPDAIIGITCHDSLELARTAVSAGADYVAFGAFFPSKTKPNAKPASLSLLTQAREQLKLPIVAIGGITVDNAQQLIDAGADMIAVIHALYAAEEITQQAQRFAQQFTN